MSDYCLFGTEGCHLCEQAEQILAESGTDFFCEDIISDPRWLEDYRLLIPVLLHRPSGRLLKWPFNQEQLQNFINLSLI